MVQVPKWKKLYSTFKKMSPSDFLKKTFICDWGKFVCVKRALNTIYAANASIMSSRAGDWLCSEAIERVW